MKTVEVMVLKKVLLTIHVIFATEVDKQLLIKGSFLLHSLVQLAKGKEM